MPDITKKCEITGKDFVINEWEQGILKKMGFPLPTLEPEERLKIRLAHRNQWSIYKDTCDLTGKPMISLYAPGNPYTVYSQEAWWSDDWDSKDYGRDFDFGRPFFEQFHELQLEVPRLGLMNTKAENSEYCNTTTSNKNCYLVFGGDFNEDCMYSFFNMYCKNCSDLYWVCRLELCYECIDCENCYNCKYLQNCNNCRDCSFLFECRGCSNCFGCVNLANKQYYIFNKKYSKEDYLQKIKEFRLDLWSEVQKMKEKFAEFKLGFPHKFAHILNSENVSGDNIINAKNCTNCFDITGPAEDIKDIYLGGWNLKDTVSCDHVGHKGELFYEDMGTIGGYNCAFCTFSWDSSDIYYSDSILANCKDLFGCVGMKKTQYCILNKQYSKEEYFDLRDQIIEHMKKTPSSGGSSREWGNFYPMKYSPFAYNETDAYTRFPMSKEEVLETGLRWHDEEKEEIGSGPEFPDCIDETGDDVLDKTFICEKSGAPFKINEKELKFYRRMKIPIPHFAHRARNKIRYEMRNPQKVWNRKCDKCGVDISTSYAPGRPETVYCEKCYFETVI